MSDAASGVGDAMSGVGDTVASAASALDPTGWFGGADPRAAAKPGRDRAPQVGDRLLALRQPHAEAVEQAHRSFPQ